jgi:aryl-alcohol dehydrogenase-like predicted oxidoreductase
VLSEKNFDRVEALTAYAEKEGHTILELAFAWLASQPTIGSIIAGATSPEQVRANVAAVEWRLSERDLSEVERILDATRRPASA